MRKSFTILLGVLSIILTASKCEKDDYGKLVKDTAIKTEFASNPPVADNVTLQFLNEPNKWGNFRMSADLRRQLTDPVLAYEIDGEKIVLRDDGKGADSVKGDGIYSVFVNIDTNEVKEMITTQNASIAMLNRQEEGIREISSLLKIQRGDTARFTAMHTLLQTSPSFRFENRSVKFDKKVVPFIDVSSALKLRIPIPIFPTLICPPPPANLIPKSLMITDLTVVEDPTRTWNPVTTTGNKTGAWTFNNLINQMVNNSSTGKTATEFVLTWLQTWSGSITLNGDVASARTGINTLISDWKQRSLANGLPADTLDMAEAPVKLLAIVNRIDLKDNVGYSSTNAGEGRFVFGVMSANGTAVFNTPEAFTIIFEYGVKKKGCTQIKNWGQQWYNLHTLAFGEPYNIALQAITDQFANANTDPAKPNGSSLNQIRTNEIALTSPWQLREFNIDATTHLLTLVTVKKTPRDGSNNSPALADFINDNCSQILSNTHNVPDTLIGAKSDNPTAPAWNASITICSDVDNTRHVFSLNTCNACHGVETSTGFTHVNTASFGTTAGLSGFLTGIPVNDPISGTSRTFSDLDDRARGLQLIVCMACKKFGPLFFKANKMVH